MIIFASILTTFNVSNIFWETQALPEIGMSLKQNHHTQVKRVQIPGTHDVNTLVIHIKKSIIIFKRD